MAYKSHFPSQKVIVKRPSFSMLLAYNLYVNTLFMIKFLFILLILTTQTSVLF